MAMEAVPGGTADFASGANGDKGHAWVITSAIGFGILGILGKVADRPPFA